MFNYQRFAKHHGFWSCRTDEKIDCFKLPEPLANRPSYFIERWRASMKLGNLSNSETGTAYERAFCVLFCAIQLQFRAQEKFGHPDVNCDFMIHEFEKPIGFSVKASLKERWRQFQYEADLISRSMFPNEMLFFCAWSSEEKAGYMPDVDDGFAITTEPEKFDRFMRTLEKREFGKLWNAYRGKGGI